MLFSAFEPQRPTAAEHLGSEHLGSETQTLLQPQRDKTTERFTETADRCKDAQKQTWTGDKATERDLRLMRDEKQTDDVRQVQREANRIQTETSRTPLKPHSTRVCAHLSPVPPAQVAELLPSAVHCHVVQRSAQPLLSRTGTDRLRQHEP